MVSYRKVGHDNRVLISPAHVRRLGQIVWKKLAARELGDHLLVLDRGIRAALFPVDQLLDWRRQIAIGGDRGDELAKVEGAAQREVAADRVEEKRRCLRKQGVQILDGKFALIEIGADLEQVAKATADLGVAEAFEAVRLDRARTVDHLADAAG